VHRIAEWRVSRMFHGVRILFDDIVSPNVSAMFFIARDRFGSETTIRQSQLREIDLNVFQASQICSYRSDRIRIDPLVRRNRLWWWRNGPCPRCCRG